MKLSDTKPAPDAGTEGPTEAQAQRQRISHLNQNRKYQIGHATLTDDFTDFSPEATRSSGKSDATADISGQAVRIHTSSTAGR